MKKGVFVTTLLLSGIFLTCCSKKSDNTPETNVISLTHQDTVAFATLNTQESLFDNVYYALGSLGWNNTAPLTTVAVNGQPVGKILDKKGGLDMTLSGTLTPTLGFPVLTDNIFVTFTNQPSTWYQSASFAAVKPPYEVWFVQRWVTGQRYEATSQGGQNGAYLGDSGGKMRAINSQYVIANSTFPTVYNLHLLRLVVNDNNTADYYCDGIFEGSVTFTDAADYPNKVVKTILSIGVVTNNTPFDWAAMYFKKGTFSSADAATVYNSISTKWLIGSAPTNQILLDGIGWNNVGGTYTPTIKTITPPTGKTTADLADVSTWDYKWYWDDGATNYTTQTLFSTKRVVTTADFPAGYNTPAMNGFSIKVLIRPKDLTGKNWRYFEGTFGQYGLSSWTQQ